MHVILWLYPVGDFGVIVVNGPEIRRVATVRKEGRRWKEILGRFDSDYVANENGTCEFDDARMNSRATGQSTSIV